MNKDFIEILREKGLLNEAQISEILEINLKEGKPIEEILIEMNLLDEDGILRLLKEVSNLPVVDLDRVVVDREAFLHIPLRIQNEYTLIPIRKTGMSLAVAMANPLNENALNEMKRVTDLRIIPLLSKPSKIKEAIKKMAEESEGSGLEFTWTETPVSQYTFENFVVDKSNEAAYAALLGIAKGTYSAQSPIILFGPPGCGKTHLLHAVVNERNGKGVILKTSPKNIKIPIEGVKIVLIDNVEDLHFLKELQDFTDRGGILVLSTRKRPDELGESKEGAVKVGILPPSSSLKEAILVKYKDIIGDEIVKFLAKSDISNVKELIGVAEILKHEKEILKREINVERAKNLLYGVKQ